MRQRTGLCFTFTKESGTVDKRKEENLRVKINITNTLFRLMEQKSLAEITITELVKGAGVARASFYRNYESKEDVLVTLIRDVLELFRRNVKESPEGLYARENILMSFRFFYRYRRYLLDLCRCGFASLMLEELNHFHESMEGTMPSSSMERYSLYMYIGALFNTTVTWLSDENPVPPEEMAGFFYRKIHTQSSLLPPGRA